MTAHFKSRKIEVIFNEVALRKFDFPDSAN